MVLWEAKGFLPVLKNSERQRAVLGCRFVDEHLSLYVAEVGHGQPVDCTGRVGTCAEKVEASAETAKSFNQEDSFGFCFPLCFFRFSQQPCCS